MDLLVEERLLSTDVDPDTRETTIEPAHEALLRQWGRLEGWLEEDLRELSAIEGVRRAARDWAANAKNPQWLAHVAGRLEDAEAAAEREDLRELLQPTDRAYLAAAREAEDRRIRAEVMALRRQRMLAMVAGGIFAVASIVAGYLWVQADAARKAEETARIAEQEARRQADAQRIIAEASERIARSRLALSEGSVEEALRLALEGLRLHPSAAARSAALAALMETSPNLATLVRGAGAQATHVDWSAGNITIASRDGTLTAFSADGSVAGTTDLLAGGAPEPQWLHEPVLVRTLDDGAVIAVLTSGEIVRSAPGGSISSVAAPAGSAPLYAGPHRLDADATGTVFALTRTDRTVLVRRCSLAASRPACRDTVLDTLDPEALALTRDGSRLALAARDGAIAIHDTQTGETLASGSSREADPLSAAWSADARLLAVGTRTGKLTIIDAARLDAPGGGILAGNEVTQSALTALRWSPSGPMLAGTCGERDICVFDLGTIGEDALADPHTRLFGHASAIAGLAWSRDGTALASIATDADLRVWTLAQDTRVRHELAPASWQPLLAVAADPASGTIAAGNDAGLTFVWKDGTGPVQRMSQGAPDPVSSLALSPGGHLALVHERLGVSIGTLGRQRHAAAHARLTATGVSRVAINAEGVAVAVPSSGNSVAVLEPGGSAPRLVSGPRDQGEPFGIAFHPDGKRFFTSQTDGALMQWSLSGDPAARVLADPAASGPHAIGGGSVSVSPDGRWLTASNAARVVVHDLTGAREPVRLEFDEGDRDVKTVAFSPAGDRLAVLMSSGKLYVWAWAGEQSTRLAAVQAVPERSIAGHRASRRRAASWIAWAGDTSLAIATAAGRVQLLNLDEASWRSRAEDLNVSTYSAGE